MEGKHEDHPEGQDGEVRGMGRGSHVMMIWTRYLCILLGISLITGALSAGYSQMELIISDLVSGAIVVVFSILALKPGRPWAPWVVCFVGIWLLFAPLAFWAEDASAYFIDSLIGALLIALTVLIPMMPGMDMEAMMQDTVTPPGWSYNPSSWWQRAPIIALGFVGLFASRYLTAHQLGYIDHAWDPFFGDSTYKVLNSDLSKAWPISDAGLGTMSYTLEALMGFMGSPKRWRTMPWMVTFFGILVIPLGAVSIFLVIMQPVGVGNWCSLCLLTAIAMLIMIPLTLDEVVAMGQFLVAAHRRGDPFWRTFFKGGKIDGTMDERSPEYGAPAAKTVPAMFWGMSYPLPLMLSVGLGLWVMVIPDAFNIGGAAANSCHLVGALIVTCAVIAIAEVGRAARWLNVPLGLWIAASGLVLGGMNLHASVACAITGVLIAVCSTPRGPVKDEYGGFERYIV